MAHSTESVLLSVLNDNGGSACLVLVDLTAAFDSVDHSLALARFQRAANVPGVLASHG